MPKVTVLMPVYNGESYLRETIESILAQTFRDFEFLIVDDGSEDTTPLIIDSYCDNRIKVLKNATRLKLSGALNRGLDEARGDFVARMDADDLALPERLARQVEFLEQNIEVGICGAWINRFGKGRNYVDKNFVHEADIKAYSLFDCPFFHPTVMMRKSLLDKYSLRYDGDYYPTEDYELWTRAVDYFPCANIGKVLLKYRVHKASMTNADWSNMDSKGVLIAKNCLEKIGLQCTEEDLRYHRNIGRAGSYRCKEVGELLLAEQWLNRIIVANQKVKKYDEYALRNVIALVWFRLCFNAAPLGFQVLRKYRSINWIRLNEKRNQRSLLIFFSIIKNSIKNLS